MKRGTDIPFAANDQDWSAMHGCPADCGDSQEDMVHSNLVRQRVNRNDGQHHLSNKPHGSLPKAGVILVADATESTNGRQVCPVKWATCSHRLHAIPQ